MKKACPYCGKIHDRAYICQQKPVYQKRNTEAERFRKTYVWQCKSRAIMKRDMYLCKACQAELPGTIRRLETEGLSVHHIRPIKAAPELRLDDDNLITLCRAHHEAAERGTIPAEVLQRLARNDPPEG